MFGGLWSDVVLLLPTACAGRESLGHATRPSQLDCIRLDVSTDLGYTIMCWFVLFGVGNRNIGT